VPEVVVMVVDVVMMAVVVVVMVVMVVIVVVVAEQWHHRRQRTLLFLQPLRWFPGHYQSSLARPLMPISSKAAIRQASRMLQQLRQQ